MPEVQSERRSHDPNLKNRMDRGNLEPHHRLHEGQSRLQELLCRENGKSTSGNGYAVLQGWVCVAADAESTFTTFTA